MAQNTYGVKAIFDLSGLVVAIGRPGESRIPTVSLPHRGRQPAYRGAYFCGVQPNDEWRTGRVCLPGRVRNRRSVEQTYALKRSLGLPPDWTAATGLGPPERTPRGPGSSTANPAAGYYPGQQPRSSLDAARHHVGANPEAAPTLAVTPSPRPVPKTGSASRAGSPTIVHGPAPQAFQE
jgi:hypothetical protein